MFRIQIFAAVATALFSLSIMQPVPAAAQQTKVDYTRIIRNAQAAEEVYIRFEETAQAEIDALNAIRGNYVIKTGDG